MSGEKQIDAQVKGAVKKAKAKKGAGAGQAKPTTRKTSKAFPFKVDKCGIWRQVTYDKADGTTGKKWQRFGSELHVLAKARNSRGEAWGLLIEVVDSDRNHHKFIIQMSMLMGTGEAVRSSLANCGFVLASSRNSRNWLMEYLTDADPIDKVISASGTGWIIIEGKPVFVFPNGAIGANGNTNQVILENGEQQDHSYNVAGTLPEWQEHVAAKAAGNSRLVVAICAAMAAPIIYFTDDQGCGVHFHGSSSTGKTTTLELGGSAWGVGGKNGWKRTYRATANGLESTAVMHNGALGCFDEMGMLAAQDAGETAYMLSSGQGKIRMSRDGNARPPNLWCMLYLSSGELTLADKMKEAKNSVAAGMTVRVIDLRADAGAGMGLFEELHGSKDPATFAQELKAAAGKYYGTAARAWITIIAKDPEAIRAQIGKLRQQFVKQVVPEGADGQVERVAKIFALLAAAGELATAEGITGWPQGEAVQAARRCFKDWVRERGGIGSNEVADARQRIEETIQVDGRAKFQHWHWNGSDRIQVLNRMGFRKSLEDTEADETKLTYYFMPSPLKNLLSGLDFRTVIAGLVEIGVITSHNGKPYKTYKVPKEGACKLYEVNLEALGKGFPDAL